MNHLLIAIVCLVALLPLATAQHTCSASSSCPDGTCCSQWGWCGTTQAHCAAGCQSNCWSGGQPQPPLLPPPQLQVPPAEPAFGGDGTWYNPSVGTGACGWFNADTELVAAMNAPQYGSYGNPNDSAVCGKCAHVCGPNGCVTVKIVDRCPPCIQGSLDLSPAAFASIADPTLGRIHINWNFVDC